MNGNKRKDRTNAPAVPRKLEWVFGGKVGEVPSPRSSQSKRFHCHVVEYGWCEYFNHKILNKLLFMTVLIIANEKEKTILNIDEGKKKLIV